MTPRLSCTLSLLLWLGGVARAERIWLSPTTVTGPHVWFADELVPVDEAVAAVVARRRHAQVIPPAEVRAAMASLQQGRVPGAANACATGGPPEGVFERMHADAVHGDPTISCEDGPCELFLELRSARTDVYRDPGRALARYVVALRGQDPKAWAASIRRRGLAIAPPPTGAAGGLLGGSIGIAGASEVPWSDVTLDGPWAEQGLDVLRPQIPALQACEDGAGPWLDWWMQRTQIAVDADGRVTRCEPLLSDHLPRPGFACQCQVLRAIALPAGKPGRRASFWLSFPTRGPISFHRVGFVPERVSDPSALLSTERAWPIRALTACLDASARPAGKYTAPAHFDVGADGRATAQRVTWPSALEPAVTRCLDAAMVHAAFNCPLSGSASVDGRIEITLSRPKTTR